MLIKGSGDISQYTQYTEEIKEQQLQGKECCSYIGNLIKPLLSETQMSDLPDNLPHNFSRATGIKGGLKRNKFYHYDVFNFVVLTGEVAIEGLFMDGVVLPLSVTVIKGFTQKPDSKTDV